MPSKRIVKAKEYKVKDKDTLESIAQKNSMKWQDLTKFNFGTDNPDEINVKLRNLVGCLEKTKDGKNYIFTKDDDPGIIYIPKDFPDKTYDAVPSTSSTSNSIVVQPVVKKKFTPADCIVKFRPKTQWAGGYGFDWFREGDYAIYCNGKNILGDIKFKDIVGYLWINKSVEEEVEEKVRKTGFWYTIIGWFGIKKYKTVKKKVIRQVPIIQPDGNKYAGTFKKDDALFVKVENEYGKTNISWPDTAEKKYKERYTNYLSIYVDKDKAKYKAPQDVVIQAFIKVDKAPEKIYFNFNKEHFKIDPKTLPNSTTEKDVKITCIKAFDSEETIDVHAIFRDEKSISHDIIVGNLKVQANSKKNIKSVDLLFIKVKTPAISGLDIQTGDPASNAIFIEEKLHQALIHPSSTEVELDLTKDDIKADFEAKYVNGTELRAKGTNDTYISEYCIERLKTEINDFDTKYDNHLRILFFAENCEDYNGYSLGKNIVLFPSANEATATHEIGHGLGLPHTFTGNDGGTGKARCKFTYNYKKTENIMDYSHHLRNGAGAHARVAFYHWQWGTMRSSPRAK